MPRIGPKMTPSTTRTSVATYPFTLSHAVFSLLGLDRGFGGFSFRFLWLRLVLLESVNAVTLLGNSHLDLDNRLLGRGWLGGWLGSCWLGFAGSCKNSILVIISHLVTPCHTLSHFVTLCHALITTSTPAHTHQALAWTRWMVCVQV
jgi:hypothetical protein